MSALVVNTNEQDTEAVQDQQYLTFTLSGELFAMPIRQVKEIIEFGQITSVPMMPAHMRGVINLRGAVVPVIDLAFRFWSGNSKVGRRTCIVIMELTTRQGDAQDTQVLGVIVDAVNAVMDIPASTIGPPPSFGANIRTDFIQGMGKVKDRLVVILNVDKTLSIDELNALRKVPEPPLAFA